MPGQSWGTGQSEARRHAKPLDTVKRIPPDKANHEQNGYAKVYDDKYTIKTNVDNDNCDTAYTDKHKHNMREV